MTENIFYERNGGQCEFKGCTNKAITGIKTSPNMERNLKYGYKVRRETKNGFNMCAKCFKEALGIVDDVEENKNGT